MKVYALIISRGSWDDYAAWTCGIFDDPFKADEGKRKLISQIEAEKNKYTNEECTKMIEEVDAYEDNFENMPTHLKVFHEWYYSSNVTAYNTESFCVKEFEVNTVSNSDIS